MATRTLKQLYTLLLDRVEKEVKSGNFIFICNQIHFLHLHELISDEEFIKLDKHFKKNKPTEKKHVKFYKHNTFLLGGITWWKSYEKEQRVLFIKHLISKLK